MIICEQLKDISESLYTASTGEISSDPYVVIPVARTKIFDFNYELFDESYKAIFEEKIIKHYYSRRICTNNYNQWKLWLDAKLNEILPYYNQLYKSAALELNPLYNFMVDVSHKDSGGDTLVGQSSNNKDLSMGTTTQNTHNRNKSGVDVTNTENANKNVTNTENTNKNVNKYNDTPQGRLTDIEEGTYLTEATIVNDNGTGKSIVDNNGTGKSTVTYGSKNEEAFKEVVTGKNIENVNGTKNETLTTDRQYTEHVMGRKDASDADLLIRFRQTFLNIDLMVIDELNELFEGLFHPSDFGIDCDVRW